MGDHPSTSPTEQLPTDCTTLEIACIQPFLRVVGVSSRKSCGASPPNEVKDRRIRRILAIGTHWRRARQGQRSKASVYSVTSNWHLGTPSPVRASTNLHERLFQVPCTWTARSEGNLVHGLKLNGATRIVLGRRLPRASKFAH